MDVILETKNLSKHYGTGESLVKAVDNTNIKIHRGEFAAITGKSGSGKSTLLHLLGGLDNPTSGQVVIDGEDIAGFSEEKLAVFRRRKIGFIFQAFNLVPSLNVWENIVLPLGLDSQQPDKDYINDIVETLDLTKKKNSMPNTLSGGQQQRVAIARALASKPAIILADEPTGNLDSKNGSEVINLLKMSAKKYGQTLLIITHDEDIAGSAERVIFVEDGKVVRQ